MPAPATQKTEIPLIEVFSSIQGEGPLVGYRQIFLRLPNCNLNCRYCDTPFEQTDSCLLEDPPGSGEILHLENPVNRVALMEILRRWCLESPGAHHSFSITGGEPLLHAEMLRDWLPQLRELLPIYLETNGTLPNALEQVIGLVDWVSMDIKLESQTGIETDWDSHRAFLDCAKTTNCCVKLVVGNDTPALELQMAAEMLADANADIPLILQPVTRDGHCSLATSQLIKMQRLIAGTYANVRVIPQIHVYMGLM